MMEDISTTPQSSATRCCSKNAPSNTQSQVRGKKSYKDHDRAVDEYHLQLSCTPARRGLLVAKKLEKSELERFIEEIFVHLRRCRLSLFVPRDAIKKTDCVLIVDDIIDSGETQRAMMKESFRAKAEFKESTLSCPLD